jgi:hypothetical protein
MASHVDQFCSTQLAAWFALCWASWSEGTVGSVSPEGVGVGDGDGDGPAAVRTADKNTAGTSWRCAAPPVRVGKVTK